MDAPTLLDPLAASLEAVDRAVEGCLALAWDAALTGDARRAAARRTVDAYQAADRRVDVLLEAIIAAGGARGLDDALGAAHRRATERLTACYALRAGTDDPHADRAALVAEHAADRALERLSRAQVVARDWIARQRKEAA